MVMKKTLAFVLCLSMLMSMFVFTVPAFAEGEVYGAQMSSELVYMSQIKTANIAGDLDGNGLITKDDAIYLLMYTFFPEDYPIEWSVDFNGDNNVTKDDAIYLLMYTFFPEDYPIIPEAPEDSWTNDY